MEVGYEKIKQGFMRNYLSITHIRVHDELY